MGNAMERRGRVIRVIPTLVNRQREEPTGCDGERQLSMDGTSRVSREAQARICERLGVQLPGATRPATDLHLFYNPVCYRSLVNFAPPSGARTNREASPFSK